MSRKPLNLLNLSEKFAISLLSEATSGTLGPKKSKVVAETKIDFKDRRALLDTITKLLMAKNKLDPEDQSGLDNFRGILNDGDESGGESGDRGNSSSSKTSTNGAGTHESA